jgi:hypothetical protein
MPKKKKTDTRNHLIGDHLAATCNFGSPQENPLSLLDLL